MVFDIDDRVPDKEEWRKYVQHAARVPGVTHKMPRAVVRGVLRGCVLAAEFVKGVSAPRGCEDHKCQTLLQEARWKPSQVLWKSAAAVTRVAVKFLCEKLCRRKVRGKFLDPD